MNSRGIGADIARNEDDRFLHGRGQYVADVHLPGMWHAAFHRSVHAHARIKSIRKPAGFEDRVFTIADLAGLKPIRSYPRHMPGFKPSDFPVLASGKVRFVGEPVAMAVAPTPAEAEDIAEMIEVDYEALPAAVDLHQALAPDTPLVHEEWGDNLYVVSKLQNGDFDAEVARAAHAITREFRMNRQTPLPIEGRGCVASYDTRLDEYVVYLANQLPVPMQIGLSDVLGIPQRRMRVICPDVGGSFGLKTWLEGEAVAVVWAARQLGRPVKWVQDRFEHLVTDANCRDHWYRVTAYADETGRLLAMDCKVAVDTGAYSPWPWPGGIEAGAALGTVTGPYDVKALKGEALTVASNKPPGQPYRGVARPSACFVNEIMMDLIADAVGRDPWDVRLDNLIRPEQMPFDTIGNKHLDSGDYPEALRRTMALIDVDAVRRRQGEGEPDGRRIGVGFACFFEQTAYGTGPYGYAGWGIELVPGLEPARARLTGDGELIVEVGTHSQGQGHETIFAQIASEVLDIDPTRVAVRHGDTSVSDTGSGTYTSRSTVSAGGAVAKACEALAVRIKRIGAHLLQLDPKDVRLEGGAVAGPHGSAIPLSEIGRAWYHHPENLPDDVDPEGLSAIGSYKPDADSGAFSYSIHAAVVAVDTEIGAIEVLDYALVEDCGTMVNPRLVDGQVIGGVSGGLGNALYEESVYDDQGQPLSTTLADYIAPTAAAMPDLRIEHMATPSPYTLFGMKGVGESGAVGPPAAIACAVNDALRPLGVEIRETPITPRRVLAALQEAKAGK